MSILLVTAIVGTASVVGLVFATYRFVRSVNRLHAGLFETPFIRKTEAGLEVFETWFPLACGIDVRVRTTGVDNLVVVEFRDGDNEFTAFTIPVEEVEEGYSLGALIVAAAEELGYEFPSE